jgi:hypothetical protein
LADSQPVVDPDEELVAPVEVDVEVAVLLDALDPPLPLELPPLEDPVDAPLPWVFDPEPQAAATRTLPRTPSE